MRALLLVILVALSAPTMAGIAIDSNGIQINTNDSNEVDQWKEQHSQDCSSMKMGDVTIKSDGCANGDSDGKNKQNRSVHGDNNPGKGHDKSKSGKHKDK